jgi:site-specific DNA-methyltransferase (adenine-specific)
MTARFTVEHDDVYRALRHLPDASFDALLSDPPYGLKFLGLRWDRVLPPPKVWQEARRVLRPGANALIFGGPRTFHRLAISLEDAGFRIVDCLMWLYGQGLPKTCTSLKPSWEPIILARTPGKPTPLNVAGCRIGTRAPANVVLDESTAITLDEQAGIRKSGAMAAGRPRARKDSFSGKWGGIATRAPILASSGGASRFFYCPKVRGPDRIHPTQKPTALTEWLARLLLVPGGSLLVPYAGAGSEMVGALHAGWGYCLGVDNDKNHVASARRRLNEFT